MTKSFVIAGLLVLAAPAPRSRALLSEGYPSTAYQSCNPSAVAITDEYGFKYNCRGARLR